MSVSLKVIAKTLADKFKLQDFIDDLTAINNVLPDGLGKGAGVNSTIEGDGTTAIGDYSHAEGYRNAANAPASHVEGTESSTSVNAAAAHVEGMASYAENSADHAEGLYTKALGGGSHAEGQETIAGGEGSHAEGSVTSAYGAIAHAEGLGSKAFTKSAHAEGENVIACNGTMYSITAFSDSSGTITLDKVDGLIVGDLLQVVSNRVNGEQFINIPITAINGLVVSITTEDEINEYWKKAFKKASTEYPVHAEGYNTIATGDAAHAEGYRTIANGALSHAEGENSISSGVRSHAEGSITIASGEAAHSEGDTTLASGNYSHAQNSGTIAQGRSQTAIGEFNVAQGNGYGLDENDKAFIVGNGTNDSNRSNAMDLTWGGTLDVAKDVKVAGVSVQSPVGSVIMWAGQIASIPVGWKLCNGDMLNPATFPNLFSALGTSFGGDGSTTFALPNLVDRFIVGAGSTYSVGNTGGENKHILTVAEMPTHTHNPQCSESTYDAALNVQNPTGRINGFGKVSASPVNQFRSAADATGVMGATNSSGLSQEHENRPPYFALCYIIKY